MREALVRLRTGFWRVPRAAATRMEGMMRGRVRPLAVGAVLLGALVAGSAFAAAAVGKPAGPSVTRAAIVIGWAYDGQGAMAPFAGGDGVDLPGVALCAVASAP